MDPTCGCLSWRARCLRFFWWIFGMPWLIRFRNKWLLVRRGMAETAQCFTEGGRGVVSAQFAGYGRIHFVNRWYEAQQVFSSGALHARLGEASGLRKLGMHNQGIIWNNDPSKWQLQRAIFTKAVQDRREAKREEVARLCQQATELTLQQARDAATGGGRTAGDGVVQLYALDLLRCITCRVTLGLAFGLEPGALSYGETLQLVKKVNAFFKAWEFFLLRPAWYLRTFYWREEQRHLANIRALQEAVVDVLRMATGGRWPPSAATTPSARPPYDAKSTAAWGDTPPRFLRDVMEHVAAGRLSDTEAVQLSLEMIIAGTDTSSVTLFYGVLALRDDPQLQRRLWSELRGQQTAGPCYELGQLPLLRAVLSESMRFKPVGPVVIRQATEDLRLKPLELGAPPAGGWGRQGGRHPRPQPWYDIRRGDTVVVNLAHMHRDGQIFDHPDTFHVGNFPEEPGGRDASAAGEAAPQPPSTDVTSGGPSRAFLPFGSGRKGCVGYLLALDEMTAVMWTLAREVEDLPPLPPPPPPPQPQLQPQPLESSSEQPRRAAAWWAALREAVLGGGRRMGETRRVGGGRLAPRLSELEVRWEVANQPREELLMEFRFRKLPPQGPATPERPPPPQVPLSGLTRRVARGVVVGSPSSRSVPPLPQLPPDRPQQPQPQLQLQPLQAKQPTQHQRWPRRRCLVFLTGAGGVGKTTLLQDLAGELPGLGFTMRTEVARQLLRDKGLSRTQLERDAAAFLQLQRDIIREFHRRDVLPARREVAPDLDPNLHLHQVSEPASPRRHVETEGSGPVGAEDGGVGDGTAAVDDMGMLSDRSALDAVCYVAARFGEGSREVREVLDMPEVQQLLELYRGGGKQVGSSSAAAAAAAAAGGDGDGDGGPEGAPRCLHVLVPPFQNEPVLQRPAAERDQQEAWQEAIEGPQQPRWYLQVGDATDEGGAGLGGEAGSGGSAAALSAVEDDGVRLRSSLRQLRDHTAGAERLLQRLGVPYLVLAERSREGRRSELLRILGGS